MYRNSDSDHRPPMWNKQDGMAKYSQLIHNTEEKKGTLIDFFKNNPLQDIDLDLKREKDFPRENYKKF